jgi:hypothetical protein
MDPRERYVDPIEALNAAMDGRQARLWTAMPAIVQAYSPNEMTVTLVVAIAEPMRSIDGTTITQVQLPQLIHCPVLFPSGGGFTLTFPLKAGDEGLVVFANRCIDAWWANGPAAAPNTSYNPSTGQTLQAQPQQEYRMHDLSDGFFIPKCFSQPKVITNPSTTSTQLRSDDGQAYFEVAANHAVNVITSGAATVKAAGNASVQSTGGTVTLTDKAGSTIVMNGDNTGTMTFSGGLKVVGPLEVTGATKIDSTLAVTGAVTGSSSATFSGDVTAGSIDLQGHVHSGVTSGGATTGPAVG